MAAPSRYTKALGERICEHIADGLGLAEVCRLEGMPGRETVRRWLASESDVFEPFRGMYARAREVQAHTHADEVLEVARKAKPETAAADRLLVDALKWSAAKRAPRVYGTERTEHTGRDGAPLYPDAERMDLLMSRLEAAADMDDADE